VGCAAAADDTALVVDSGAAAQAPIITAVARMESVAGIRILEHPIFVACESAMPPRANVARITDEL
jgi:hypothetical protein